VAHLGANMKVILYFIILFTLLPFLTTLLIMVLVLVLMLMLQVDHILFIQKDVPHKMNVNEVGATKYVTPDELKHMFTEKVTGPTIGYHVMALASNS
jgi:vancomycin permeability regulator SanA